MYVVYHCRHARSLRVVWALEEIGADYELQVLDFQGAVMQSTDYRAINPFGSVPALRDGDHALFESGAIVDYVLARAGSGLRPGPQDADFADYLMWSHAGEATLTAPLAVIARHAMILPPDRRAPLAVADAHERWTQYADALAGRLAGRDFVAGPRFTGADIMVGYALHLAEVLDVVGAAPPRLHAYWRRLRERPAYGRAAAA